MKTYVEWKSFQSIHPPAKWAQDDTLITLAGDSLVPASRNFGKSKWTSKKWLRWFVASWSSNPSADSFLGPNMIPALFIKTWIGKFLDKTCWENCLTDSNEFKSKSNTSKDPWISSLDIFSSTTWGFLTPRISKEVGTLLIFFSTFKYNQSYLKSHGTPSREVFWQLRSRYLDLHLL